MSFEQAMQRYQELCRQYHGQQINEAHFQDAVNQLRVQDSGQNWWQLSYQGQWLRWNGTDWVPDNPPQSGGQLRPETVRQAAGYAQTAYGAAQSMAGGNPAAVLTRLARLLRPFAGKSERWWSIISILGGGVGGTLWYWYSTLDKNAKPDLHTAVIMLLVPVVLAVFRRPVDRLLAPLVPLRQKLPRLLIVGIGIAVPYFVAVFLYDNMQLREYRYIRWTVFLGPLLSYLVIRTPKLPFNPGRFNQYQQYGFNPERR